MSEIQKNMKSIQVAQAGDEVAVKIEAPHGHEVVYNRRFDYTDSICSKISSLLNNIL